MASLPALIDAFAGLDVLVVGDAMLDSYLQGDAPRICREAPVPAVTIKHRSHAPGGAANAACNVAALGARVRFLSVVGNDTDGGVLRAALREHGVDDLDVLVAPGRQTTAKRRVLAGEQMVVRFDEGGPQQLSRDVEDELLRRLDDLVDAADAVIVSDYEHGLLTRRLIDRIGELQRHRPRVLVVDARSLEGYRHIGATAVKPNYDEIAPLLSHPAEFRHARPDAVLACCAHLPDLTGAHIVAVTLDREGAVVCERGAPPYRTYTRPTSSSRATGAGDSFTSGLALALAAQADTPTAAEVASAAAGVVIARDRTACCSAEDLRQHFAQTRSRLEEPARLAERLLFYRREGRRIVFTNGCFDLLHRGHIDFLNRAKALGDVLVVGLNSDESMRRLKGRDRPINRLEDRAQVLGALSPVDHLAAFDAETADELIELVRPDVYAKGGDYTREMVPEAEHVERLGGTVQILPYLEDRSTTGIIERIRATTTPVVGLSEQCPQPEPR